MPLQKWQFGIQFSSPWDLHNQCVVLGLLGTSTVASTYSTSIPNSLWCPSPKWPVNSQLSGIVNSSAFSWLAYSSAAPSILILFPRNMPSHPPRQPSVRPSPTRVASPCPIRIKAFNLADANDKENVCLGNQSPIKVSPTSFAVCLVCYKSGSFI